MLDDNDRRFFQYLDNVQNNVRQTLERLNRT